MVANINNSDSQIEMLLNILTNVHSKNKDLLKDTIGISDWRSSLMNASSKNIEKVLVGIHSVNKFLQRHVNDNETFTGNSSSILKSDGFNLSTFTSTGGWIYNFNFSSGWNCG